MDWLDLLAIQGTLKSLLQHHSSKAWCSYLLLSIKSFFPLIFDLVVFLFKKKYLLIWLPQALGSLFHM